MERSDWDRLSAPFPREELTWRIEELAPDEQTARVRPQLRSAVICQRLDDVVGREGWSFRFESFGAAVGCQLEIGRVTRSAIVDPVVDAEGAEGRGGAALARAAELFGLMPPADASEEYWVDYDRDEQEVLTPALPLSAESISSVSERAAATPEGAARTPDRGAGPSASPEAVKPEGQQAIDRLLERLKVEGHGLEAARLLVDYGGYGSDPQAARELYRRLRELLASRAEPTT